MLIIDEITKRGRKTILSGGGGRSFLGSNDNNLGIKKAKDHVGLTTDANGQFFKLEKKYEDVFIEIDQNKSNINC